MSQCKPTSTPLEHNAKLYIDDDTKEENGTLYHQLVGSSNYLTSIRLDIAYSVNILSQFITGLVKDTRKLQGKSFNT